MMRQSRLLLGICVPTDRVSLCSQVLSNLLDRGLESSALEDSPTPLGPGTQCGKEGRPAQSPVMVRVPPPPRPRHCACPHTNTTSVRVFRRRASASAPHATRAQLPATGPP